jgi:DNA-binding transcriptional LysR family regulator
MKFVQLWLASGCHLLATQMPADAYPDQDGTNRRVDVIEEGFDVALRVRMPPLESSDLVMKVLGGSTLLLVGSPALIERFGRPHSPVDLMRFESLSLSFAPANRHGS